MKRAGIILLVLGLVGFVLASSQRAGYDTVEGGIKSVFSSEERSKKEGWETARWVSADSKAELDRFIEAYRAAMAEDRDGAPVFLARNAWDLNYVRERNPDIRFAETRERH